VEHLLDARKHERNYLAETTTIQVRKNQARKKLLAVKWLHTMVWAFFAACIVSLPVLGAAGYFRAAGIVFGIVMAECVVLVVNGWRCPLTDVAKRYTAEREENFDIFLPRWLAKWNKTIFGILFIVNVIWVLAEYGWMRGR
jgi:hypothetical protein